MTAASPEPHSEASEAPHGVRAGEGTAPPALRRRLELALLFVVLPGLFAVLVRHEPRLPFAGLWLFAGVCLVLLRGDSIFDRSVCWRLDLSAPRLRQLGLRFVLCHRHARGVRRSAALPRCRGILFRVRPHLVWRRDRAGRDGDRRRAVLHTYLVTRSLLIAAIEHSLYGLAAFGSGLGQFLYLEALPRP